MFQVWSQKSHKSFEELQCWPTMEQERQYYCSLSSWECKSLNLTGLHLLQEEGRKNDRRKDRRKKKQIICDHLKRYNEKYAQNCSVSTHMYVYLCVTVVTKQQFWHMFLTQMYLKISTWTVYTQCLCVSMSEIFLPCLAAAAFWAASSLAFLAASMVAILASCTSFRAFHSFLLFIKRSSMGVISTWKRLNSWSRSEERINTNQITLNTALLAPNC